MLYDERNKKKSVERPCRANGNDQMAKIAKDLIAPDFQEDH